MTNATELDARRAQLVEEAKRAIADAAADGVTDPVATEPAIKQMIEATEELRTAADLARVEAKVSAEREAANEQAAKIFAEQETQAEQNKPESITSRLRASALAGRNSDVEISLARAKSYTDAVASGMTANDFQQRALTVGTAATAGALVPDLLETVIYDSMRTVQGLKSAGAEVVTTAGGGDLNYPKIDTPFNVTGTLESTEGSAISDTQDTYKVVTLKAYKYNSQVIVSHELMEDHGTNLEQVIGRRLGEIIAEKQETRFTTGTGTNMPKGITNGVAAGRTQTSAFTATGTSATTAPNIKDFSSVLGSLDPKYIARGITWMMNSDTFFRVIGQTDTTGQLIHLPRTHERPFDTLLGHRVSFNNFMDSYAASKNVVIGGDINSAYVIRELGTFNVATSSEHRFLNQEIIFQGTHRVDGQVRDETAYRLIKTAGS